MARPSLVSLGNSRASPWSESWWILTLYTERINRSFIFWVTTASEHSPTENPCRDQLAHLLIQLYIIKPLSFLLLVCLHQMAQPTYLFLSFLYMYLSFLHALLPQLGQSQSTDNYLTIFFTSGCICLFTMQSSPL